MWRCRQERAVKPSAQPTLVRTQHLPPPAKTARSLRKRGPAGRFLLVPPCVIVCRCRSSRSDRYGHIADSVRAEGAVRGTACFADPRPFCPFTRAPGLLVWVACVGAGSCLRLVRVTGLFVPAVQARCPGAANAYIPGDVRLAGLTGTTTGVWSWTGHSTVALYTCSIALLYTLLICFVTFTAIRTKDADRRRTAVRVLAILTGVVVALTRAEASSEVQKYNEGDGCTASKLAAWCLTWCFEIRLSGLVVLADDTTEYLPPADWEPVACVLTSE